MTLIFSCISKNLIIMGSDSIVTNTYETGLTFKLQSKCQSIQGIGCITTWGMMEGNTLGSFLLGKDLDPDVMTILDLAKLVHSFLVDKYQPHEYEGREDVGYHIGGFDKKGNPRFFHVFWGCNRPPIKSGEEPDYHCYDHSDWKFVFNGRNEIAHSTVNTFLRYVNNGVATRYDLNSNIGLIQFCDFVLRYAAEMTPEIGPKFNFNIIFPNNEIMTIVNSKFESIQLSTEVKSKLQCYVSDQTFVSPRIELYDASNTGSSYRSTIANYLPSEPGTLLLSNKRICSICNCEFNLGEYPPNVMDQSSHALICPDCESKIR